MVPVNSINKARLEGWREKLKKSHATAIVLVGVGHDHNQGQINIVTSLDTSDSDILLLLNETVRQLEDKIISKT